MKKFFVYSARDAADVYIKALLAAGYQQCDGLLEADFFLVDKEPSGEWRHHRLEKAAFNKPVFFFPHTPYSYWLWDRWLEPMKISCNFVVGEGARMGMLAYGYPERVEICGFPRCEVKPFKPTQRKNLLYISSTRSLNWKPPQTGDRDLHLMVMDWIVKYRSHFDSVTVNYFKSLEFSLLDKYLDRKNEIDFVDIGESKDLSSRTAIRSLEGKDLVIAGNTAGYIALASGYPTILFNNYKNAPQNSATGFGWHWDLYKDHYVFPLSLFDMDIDEVLNVRLKKNTQVEKWKDLNIGGNFDGAKFISIVQEYVK